jgi:hypothetical protein
VARRPLEREGICLDGGRRTTQLMRDSLGGPTTPMASRLLVELLVIGPPAVFANWYRGRLREVKEGEAHDPKDTQAMIDHDKLSARVTREGFLVLAAVVIYWLVLSVIF